MCGKWEILSYICHSPKLVSMVIDGPKLDSLKVIFCCQRYLPDHFQWQEHDLSDKPRDEWIRLSVGKFKTSSAHVGKITFSLEEIEPQLIIQGVIIEPKA